VPDFYFHGTQPGTLTQELVDPQTCGLCHTDYIGQSPDKYTMPYGRWIESMMAHAYHDPVFHAALDVAEKDASGATDACIRCHAPAGWVSNRGPTRPVGNPQPFQPQDNFGISCSVCHRMVDPIERVPAPTAGTDGIFTATTDRDILEALGVNRPPNFANGGPTAANTFVLDPEDRRRGPFDLGFMPYHNWLQSDFHMSARLCAACHDVSNPAYVRQPDDTYALSPLNQPHPTGNKYEMYPLDRTFSEWLMSSFAQGPVTLTVPNPNGEPGEVGRYAFDGVTETDDGSALVIFNAATSYQSCQDCHQPRAEGPGCALGVPPRSVPVHNFSGANSWVIRSVFDLYGFDSGLSDLSQVENSVKRNNAMLNKGADLSVARVGADVNVRIINQTGHKLPTGYSEGRRMWINVKFFGDGGVLIDERGEYNLTTADLNEGDTKVYEVKHGLDNNVAAYLALRALETGNPALALPAGVGFHLDINNKVFFDNRIPPRGFTNAAFTAVQSPVIGYAYADGQYWDDTLFAIPPGARRAEVRLFHQTTTKAYAEFLRDNAVNVSTVVPQPAPPPPAPLPIGQIVYQQWEKFGKSEPVQMGFAVLDLGACNRADVTDIGDTGAGPDGELTVDDIIAFVNTFGDSVGCPGVPNVACNLADITDIGDTGAGPDGELTVDDIIAFVNSFGDGC
jgi:hypothetical protein